MSHDGLIHPSSDCAEQVAALTEQVRQLREALEKLARLGNEPHYGNSRGNEIAIAALASTEPKEKA